MGRRIDCSHCSDPTTVELHAGSRLYARKDADARLGTRRIEDMVQEHVQAAAKSSPLWRSWPKSSAMFFGMSVSESLLFVDLKKAHVDVDGEYTT